VATDRQIQANRQNARKSTGPKTPAGRAAVRLNALKHGLTARHSLLDDENRREFNQLRDAWLEHYSPATPAQLALLETTLYALWRLRRCRRLEAGYSEFRFPDLSRDFEERFEGDFSSSARLAHVLYRDASSQTLLNLSRHEARLYRVFQRSLRELDRLRPTPDPPPPGPDLFAKQSQFSGDGSAPGTPAESASQIPSATGEKRFNSEFSTGC